MTLIDSHCHLDHPQFDADRDAVIERAQEAGVETMLVIGTGQGPPELEAAIRLAERYASILATVGVHPHHASQATPETWRRMAELLKHPQVVALGEIGLDYHYDHSPRDVQRAVFLEQMAIARERAKPIVIHTREAWDDTLALLERHWKPTGLPGIMHCFSGGPSQAQRCLDLGFHLSFGGIVTFPKAEETRQALRGVPIDRILVETDAPYLAPVPQRGKRNEPAFLAGTVRRVGEVLGVPPEDVATFSRRNFRRLAGLVEASQP